MVNPSALVPYAQYTLADAVIHELPSCYRGKVRENYDLKNGSRILIATDRISAFDRILAVIPLKGQVLTQMARFWFEVTRDLCANHVMEYPDPNVLVCKRLSMMPVEIVVRDYLAGTTSTSIRAWRSRTSIPTAGRSQSVGLSQARRAMWYSPMRACSSSGSSLPAVLTARSCCKRRMARPGGRPTNSVRWRKRACTLRSTRQSVFTHSGTPGQATQ